MTRGTPGSSATDEGAVDPPIDDLRRRLESAERKLKIEAALERVRARTMAMSDSQELSEVLSLLFQQFDALGINPTFAHLTLFDEANDTFSFRMTGQSGERVLFEQIIDIDEMDVWKAAYADWKEGEEGSVVCIDYPQDVLPAVFDIFSEIFAALPESSRLSVQDFPDGLHTTQGHCRVGYLGFNHTRSATEPEKEVVARFAREFGLVYQRFLDLQMAEQQRREAQIEAALERIRAASMAMHRTTDISNVVVVFFNQLKALQLNFVQAWINVFHLEQGYFDIWFSPLEGVYDEPNHFQMPSALFEDTSIRSWKEGHRFSYLSFPSKDAVDALMQACDEVTHSNYFGHLQELLKLERLEFVDANYRYGTVSKSDHVKASREEEEILHRFGKVFEQAYTRFLDLQTAEARAREAEIEASLEKVRGRALGMQKPDDISDVSILMFDELERLGIESLRSGISIPDEDKRYDFRAATKTEDGTTTLVLGNESVDVHPVIRRAYQGWQQQEEHQVAVLEGDDLVKYYHSVFDTMPLPDWQERMKTGAEARECFATFSFPDGWIYTFVRHDITEEEISIHVRFARAFGLAYQRYHDLKKAEEDYAALLEEKARTETALTDLRATQAQLVEQEKLASLGALTAGIAHEIKNPLNFVNNFAEVNAELADELAEAVANGDIDEATAILADLRDNATQIAKHGKRADSIVRAMMQHARGGASERETIEVNTFLEEYAGLAWHGMRARDDGFAAELDRDFAEDAGSVEVMPQELGRVILNLLNNAFDAVKETEGPTVTISSRRGSEVVEIKVADNGPGIPADIRDKIFEPFFTTKPTGEGTGLGLSLSYDIVTKGHGGSMTVGESPEGGAEFTVSLPV